MMKKAIVLLTACLLTIAGVQSAHAQKFYKENDLYGILYQGKKLTEAKYSELKVLVKKKLVGFLSDENYKWGIFDVTSNKEITPAKYDFIYESSSNVSIPYRYVEVEKDGYWTFVDAVTGKEIAPIQYDKIRPFFGEEVAPVKRGGKETLLNTKGKELFPPKYDRIGLFTDDGLAVVELDDKYGYISKDGEEVIPVQFDNAFNFYCGIALVVDYTKEKGAFINKNGELITPYIYEDVLSCTEGRAAVKKDGKWGYIDTQGNQVISFIYDEAEEFIDGKAKVTINGKVIFIDKNGNEVK